MKNNLDKSFKLADESIATYNDKMKKLNSDKEESMLFVCKYINHIKCELENNDVPKIDAYENVFKICKYDFSFNLTESNELIKFLNKHRIFKSSFKTFVYHVYKVYLLLFALQYLIFLIVNLNPCFYISLIINILVIIIYGLFTGLESDSIKWKK